MRPLPQLTTSSASACATLVATPPVAVPARAGAPAPPAPGAADSRTLPADSRTVPVDGAGWRSLAATVAAATDRAEVERVVASLSAALGAEVDLDAPLVVLQRTFGRLHREATFGR